MDFLQLAYERKWVSLEDLRYFVITEDAPYGDITPEEYEIITGVPF